jgi:hypothetical protein
MHMCLVFQLFQIPSVYVHWHLFMDAIQHWQHKQQKQPSWIVEKELHVNGPKQEGGVGLVPECGCLLTLAYYAFPRWYEFGERWWNDILAGGNRRTRRKSCPSATLSSINPTWIDPGANPALRGERPATNDLSHGTALRHLTHPL